MPTVPLARSVATLTANLSGEHGCYIHGGTGSCPKVRPSTSKPAPEPRPARVRRAPYSAAHGSSDVRAPCSLPFRPPFLPNPSYSRPHLEARASPRRQRETEAVRPNRVRQCKHRRVVRVHVCPQQHAPRRRLQPQRRLPHRQRGGHQQVGAGAAQLEVVGVVLQRAVGQRLGGWVSGYRSLSRAQAVCSLQSSRIAGRRCALMRQDGQLDGLLGEHIRCLG